jgi:hypothetical protein
VTPLPVHGGNVGGDRIQAAKVVQQPPIEAIVPKGRLNRRDIKRFARDGCLQRAHVFSISGTL